MTLQHNDNHPFPPYPAYKDSGMELIGEIPEHWGLAEIKRGLTVLTDYDANGSFSTIKDNVNRVEKESERHAWLVRATDLENNRQNDLDSQEVVWVDESTYKFLRKSYLNGGELLVTKRGEIGKVYLMPEVGPPATLGPNMYLVRLNKKNITPRYSFFFFSIPIGREQLEIRNKSTTLGALYKDDFKDILIFYPPTEEQTAISNFLDHKTTQIDTAIEKHRQLIELLREHRAAIINEAVTKGLNPDAPMKDSGVEWIGEMPAHWEVNQIKRGLNLLTDYDANGSFSTIKDNVNRVETLSEQYAWLVRATDLENVRHKNLKHEKVVWVDKSTHQFLRKSYLEGGELLIAKRGEIGKVYLMPEVGPPATLGPNMYLARLNRNKIVPKYSFFFFSTSLGKQQLKIRNKSTTIGALYKDDFKDVLFFFPPIEEQQQIVNFIETETTRIDQEITLAQQEIDLLEEYRQSLIAEAVTGKIDVRDYLLN